MSAELLHRTRGKMADGDGEVEMAARPGVGGARAFAEYVSLRPEPATIWAGAYLRVVGVHSYSPIFSVPA